MFNRYHIVQEKTEKQRNCFSNERNFSSKQQVAWGRSSFHLRRSSFHFEEKFLCFTFRCLMRDLVSLYNLSLRLTSVWLDPNLIRQHTSQLMRTKNIFLCSCARFLCTLFLKLRNSIYLFIGSDSRTPPYHVRRHMEQC